MNDKTLKVFASVGVALGGALGWRERSPHRLPFVA